jgi:hypothetical protein
MTLLLLPRRLRLVRSDAAVVAARLLAHSGIAVLSMTQRSVR